MVKLDSTITTLVIAGAVAFGISYLVVVAPERRDGIAEKAQAQPTNVAAQSIAPAPRQPWAASATGRIEPKDGDVRIASQVPGKIVAVPIDTNDRVAADEILVRLDDEEPMLKIAAAEAEAAVRKRERDEEVVKGPALDRRKAEDLVADDERAVFRGRLALDAVVAKQRAGQGSADDVMTARNKLRAARERLENDRTGLQRTNAIAGMPLPTRLESALAVARTDISLAEVAVERTRIRAPFEGTVLNVQAKVGETAAPSPDNVLLSLGDLTGLRVRAEVEERDITKIRAGQRIVVKADAFPDKEFEGKVSSIAQALTSPHITTRGPRRPNDVEVLEVVADLDGNPPLLTGMRVDVFFRLDSTAAAPATKQN